MSAPSAPAWDDPSYFTAADAPADVRALGGPAGPVGVGSPGKVGVLDLAFAEVAGTTRVVRHYQRLPLYCYQPVYIDPGFPGMAFIYSLQAGEGIVAGDRYRVDLDVAAGAQAHLTTTAATKIFRMNQSYASQIVNLRAGAGAFVEYLPDPVLPFRGSRFYQRTRIVADPGATVIYGETLLPGRTARGETHAYHLYCTDTEAHAPDGKLLMSDRLELRPRSGALRSLASLGDYDVLATMYLITQRQRPAALLARLREALTIEPDVVSGASELPNEAGAFVRMLGRSSIVVARALRAVWNASRLALSGVSAPDVRKI